MLVKKLTKFSRIQEVSKIANILISPGKYVQGAGEMKKL